MAAYKGAYKSYRCFRQSQIRNRKPQAPQSLPVSNRRSQTAPHPALKATEPLHFLIFALYFCILIVDFSFPSALSSQNYSSVFPPLAATCLSTLRYKFILRGVERAPRRPAVLCPYRGRVCNSFPHTAPVLRMAPKNVFSPIFLLTFP